MIDEINKREAVYLRKIPFPYRSGLSICNDIDFTDSYEKFIAIQSFMNEQVGIKFTNTFFPFHGSEFSLFSGSEADKAAIIKYIKEGAIDAIHSYGEKIDFTRQDAIRVLGELKQNNCNLNIWIDHAQSKSNFCKYRFLGQGDIPQEKEYHADLTLAYGIKFIWTEHLTNIIGQDTPLSPGKILQIFDQENKIRSLLNIFKTLLKIILSICGYKKYIFFKNNALIKITTLKDRQKVYEFIRFNNSFKKSGEARKSSFSELSHIISDKVINQLKKNCGYSIIYVHLAKDFDLNSAKGKKAVAALLNLKKEFDNGNIYVTSIPKVLNYYITHKHLEWSYKKDSEGCHIYINAVDDPIFGSYAPSLEQLDGITFYIPEGVSVHIYNQNEKIKNIRYNPPDFTGERSVTVNYEKIN